MAKQMLFADEARNKILKGVEQLSEAVAITMGPRGRNVLIDKKFGSPNITKDGVTVAREIELEDKFENMGAQLVKEVASKTSDVAGDGTTTATVLAAALYKEGLKNVAAGANPVDIKRGIDKAVSKIVEFIKGNAQEVKEKKRIAEIGTVSANNDKEIGQIISDAMEEVGEDGVITVEEAKGMKTDLEVVEGMQFDRGYLSPYFVTNSDKMSVELENPYIIITDKKLSNMKELLPAVEKIAKSAKSFLVIGEDIEGEALATLVVNKIRGTINCAAVKAPGFGDRRKEMLSDLAVLTGGKLLSSEAGIKLENADVADFGTCKKVVIDKDNTTLVDGGGSKDDIKARIRQIDAQYEASTSSYDKEKLKERKAKLAGGVAVIKVGAATETEMKEKKARVEDALNATKAAVEEGVVVGGGVSLLRAQKSLDNLIVEDNQKVGVSIVRNALEAPIRTIAANAGFEGSVVLNKVKNFSGSMGFNAATGEYEDLSEAGIIDPAKVERIALQNAASVASLLLTTEVMVTDLPEKEPMPAMPPQGMGGGMY